MTSATVRGTEARANIGGSPEAVQYYLEALAPSGAILATLGSATDPFRPEVTGAILLTDDPEAAGSGSNWWVWTLVAVLVLAAAGGIVAGVLLTSGSGEPQSTLGAIPFE